jgi:hypothetical protein
VSAWSFSSPDSQARCFFAVSCSFARRISLARRNQAPQALANIEAPGAGTAAGTLDRRHPTDVRKAQFGLITLPGDLENDVGAVPLPLVFDEVDDVLPLCNSLGSSAGERSGASDSDRYAQLVGPGWVRCILAGLRKSRLGCVSPTPDT